MIHNSQDKFLAIMLYQFKEHENAYVIKNK
jgi:hypothetical protein